MTSSQSPNLTDTRGLGFVSPDGSTATSVNRSASPDVMMNNINVTHDVIASIMLIFSGLGTLGNLLLVCVLLSKLLRKNSYATYLTAICIADISLLGINMAESGLLLNYDQIANGSQNIACGMTALKHYTRCVSAWCSQLLTLDRLAAIFQPTRRNIICTWRKALTACSLTSLLLLLLYLVPYLTYVTKEGAEEDTGSTLASFMHACSRYGNWYPGASILDFLMTYMIPVCVMFPSWAVIFKRLAIRSKKAQVIGVTEKWTAERIRRLNKTTLCIGTVVNVAVLATIPHGINMLIVHFQEQRTTAKNMYIVFGIELLDVIGRGCHVYLLSCVSGQFRRSVYAILCPDRVALDADLMSSSVRRSALVDRLAPVAKTAARDKRVVGLNLKNGVRRATPHPIKTGKWVPPKFKERAKAPLRSLRDLSPSFDCAPPIPSSNGTRETKTDSKVTIQSDVVTYM